MRFLILFFFVSVTGYAQPDWTTDSKRRVEGSYIIHWGTGTSEQSDLAIFKAQQMAIKTIISECGGFANKEVIPEKAYSEEKDGKHVGYAKVAIPFRDCEHGKADGVTAAEVENPEIKKAQDLYTIMMQLDERGETYTEMYAHISEFSGKMNNQYRDMKADVEEFKEDQRKAYEAHISEVYAEQDETQTQINVINQRLDGMGYRKYKANVAKSKGARKICYEEYEKKKDATNFKYGGEELPPKVEKALLAEQAKCESVTNE